jgi:hypothetical protein
LPRIREGKRRQKRLISALHHQFMEEHIIDTDGAAFVGTEGGVRKD